MLEGSMTEAPSKIGSVEYLRKLIRDIPDFPKPGIVFKDITPLLSDSRALSVAVDLLTEPYRDSNVELVIGAESRGFIFATAVARNLSAGFVPIRKPGKLPSRTQSASYELEYGTDTLEIHHHSIPAAPRPFI